jgi:hypothetical protein
MMIFHGECYLLTFSDPFFAKSLFKGEPAEPPPEEEDKGKD